MGEAALQRQVDAPDARQTGTAHIEVDVQHALAGLSIRDGDRGRRDRLAFARLRRDDEQAVGHRLVAGRVEEVAQTRDGFGELGVLVLHRELRDLLALLAADVREDREDLERQSDFDIGQVDDRIFQVVQHEHEEETKHQRHEDADAEDQDRLGQDGMEVGLRLASERDDLVVRLGLETGLVLVDGELLEHVVGDLGLVLENAQTGLREQDALLERDELALQVLTLLAEVRELVARDRERRTAGLQRAGRGIEEALLGHLELLGLRHDVGMVLRVGELQLGVLTRRVEERTVLRRDLLGALSTRRQRAEALGIGLDGGESLLPFDELGFLGLETQDVGRRLQKRLLNRIARRAKVIDLVGRTEIHDLLGQRFDLAALLLHIGVDLAHEAIAPNLVNLVRIAFNGLRIGVRQVRGNLRIARTDRDRDVTGVALELDDRIHEGARQVLVRHRGRRMIRVILLDDHRQDLVGPPLGKTRVEDFRVVASVIDQGLIKGAVRATGGMTDVHREFAARLEHRRRHAIDGKGDDHTQQQEDEDREPTLRDHAQDAPDRDRTDKRTLLARLAGAAVGAVGTVRAVGAISTV